MDLANLLVDTCVNIWGSWVPQYGVPFLICWLILHKLQPFKHSVVWDTFMEYAGLVVLLLVVSLAFAYGGYYGLGALALIIALR